MHCIIAVVAARFLNSHYMDNNKNSKIKEIYKYLLHIDPEELDHCIAVVQ